MLDAGGTVICAGLHAKMQFQIATLECRVSSEGSDLTFQPDIAVAIGFGCARSCHQPVGKIRVAHSPLKRLLRAHGESNYRPEMGDLQFFGQQAVHGVYVVPDGHDRKAGSVKWFGSVAG